MGTQQVVPIPAEFELSGGEVVIRKGSGRLVIEPASRPSLLSWLAELQPIEEEFPPMDELPHDKPPTEQTREVLIVGELPDDVVAEIEAAEYGVAPPPVPERR